MAASQSPSPSSSSDEGSDGYRAGGYHPVSVGDRYGPNGRYVVEEKLGWGHFSTVWLALDTENDGSSSRLAGMRSESFALPRRVALKVQKSAEHYTEAAWDEVALLTTVARCAEQRLAKSRTQLDNALGVGGPGKTREGVRACGNAALRAALAGEVYTVRLVDRFEHNGPNGKHVCMVFEVLGDNLLRLIKHYNYEGVPVHLVKQIVRQVCVSLDFLHRDCGIIHTDLKPENVLIAGLRGKALVDELGDADTLPALDAYRRALILARNVVIQHASSMDSLSVSKCVGSIGRTLCSRRSPVAAICDDTIVLRVVNQLADVTLTGNARKRLKKKLRKRKKMLLCRQNNQCAQPYQSPGATSALVPDGITGTSRKTPFPPMPVRVATCLNNASWGSDNLTSREWGAGEVGQKGARLVPAQPAEFAVPWANQCCVGILAPVKVIAAAFGVGAPHVKQGSCELSQLTSHRSAGRCFAARFFCSTHGVVSDHHVKQTHFTVSGVGFDPVATGIWRHALAVCAGKVKDRARSNVVGSLPHWRQLWQGRRFHRAKCVSSPPRRQLEPRRQQHHDLSLKRGVNARPAVWSIKFDVRYAHDLLAVVEQLFGENLPGFSWTRFPPEWECGRHHNAGFETIDLMCEMATWHFRVPSQRYKFGAVLGFVSAELPEFKSTLITSAVAVANTVFCPEPQKYSGARTDPCCGRRSSSATYMGNRTGGGAFCDDWDVVGDGSSVAKVLDRMKLKMKIKQPAPTWTQVDHEGIVLNPLTGVIFAPQEDIIVKVVDLGNGCWIHKHFAEDIQTRQYRAPEVILRSGYDTSADIWSLACVVFELVTGDILFDPRAGDDYERDEDHLALFMELLGKLPSKLTSGAKYSARFFDRKGGLKHIRKLRYWGLCDVLGEKYQLSPEDASSLANFLMPMLSFDVSQRATAADCLRHSWLAE